ncbi:BGTF surface domain-containing protein, partial [Halorubrum sp. HHNYT27]|uniref:BGTF surface domain-containing protein n=1 Tax=Halorubrum sp. HHNYT27 TaxID=3402275 RepID=UPI003EBE7E12
MTNDNTTRKKASAVFFAAVMVLSMVAVGFAAAPAAAATLADDFDRNAGSSSGATLYQGQEVLYDVSNVENYDGGNLELRTVDTSGDDPQVGNLEQALDPEGDDFVIIDTGDIDAGQYVITTQGTGDNVDTTTAGAGDIRFEVAVQDLTTEFDEDTVADEGNDALVEYEITSNVRNNYAVNVEAEGLDEDDLADIFGNEYDDEIDLGDDYDRYDVAGHINDTDATNLSNDYALHEEDGYITLFRAENPEHELNFTDIDAGEYEFEVSVVDSTGTDSDTITVEDIDGGDVEIEESSLNIAQGDTVEFTVTADGATDTGTVVIGNEEDFGYQANVSIDDFGDDDQITLEFNTYTAGNLSGSEDPVSIVDTDDDDDEITFDGETDLDSILATGDYDISSDSSSDFEDTVDSSDDVATLFIEERSTDGIQTWTTPDSTANDIIDADEDEQLDEITAAVDQGTLTQTSDFAHGDTSVHQISASGLEGALDYAGEQSGVADDDASEQLAYLATNSFNDINDDNAIEFRIRETRASAGPNTDRTTIVPDGNQFDVVVDEENDDYYVILDTSDLGLEDDEDYEFDVEFTVQDERLLDPDDEVDADEFEDSYNTVSANFSIDERTADFDQDPYDVTPTEGQNITGTTNVAPGTEFTIRARSATGTQPSFVKIDDEVIVAADGTWEGEFDFSDTSVGDEYTLSLQQLQLNDAVEVDGTVVEQVQAPAVFEVSDLSPAEATVTAGDTIDASATIENTGEQEATQTVEFRVDGEAVASEDVTLAGGESTTFEASIDT